MSKEETASVLVRMPKALLDQIDVVRGDVPRTVYIRRILREEMARVIRAPASAHTPDRPLSTGAEAYLHANPDLVADSISRPVSLQLGPTKLAAGSRLKKGKP